MCTDSVMWAKAGYGMTSSVVFDADSRATAG